MDHRRRARLKAGHEMVYSDERRWLVPARWLMVPTRDGRELEVVVAGPEDGLPLLFHTGTPTAAAELPEFFGPAAARGLQTVVYSRPGYGASTVREGRSVADAAGDVQVILAELQQDRFVTLGWSGGGPHALACAALLPGRCAAAATLAGVAPYDVEGLDWFSGQGPENVAEFAAALSGAAALTAHLERDAIETARVTGEELAASLGGLLPAVDNIALTGSLAEAVAEMFRRSVSTGVAGWRDDDLAFIQSWGFDLSRITVPVSIWQGGQDLMVPFEHGKWLAAHIPNARAHLYEDEGHVSLVHQLPRILDDLLHLAAPS